MLFVEKNTSSSCNRPPVDEKEHTEQWLRFVERGNLCLLKYSSSSVASVLVSQLRHVTSLLVFVLLPQCAGWAPMLTMSAEPMPLARWAVPSSLRVTRSNCGPSMIWSTIGRYWNTMTSPWCSNCAIHPHRDGL